MSRIGKKPIDLPDKVTASISGSSVTIEGPKGSLECGVSNNVQVKQEEKQLIFELTKSCNPNNPNIKAEYGTSRALVSNAVAGVTEGWKRSLELHGVGYNAKLAGKELELSVGYSHKVKFTVPNEVNCQIEKNTIILLESINKQILGNFAAKIRKSCPPEPYLGKGIRYSDEKVRRKAGKAGGK